MERTAIYAGSFDPITLGHLDIIERASLLFDSVTVAVVANPSKKSLFDLEERVFQVRDATMHIPNVRVERFQGLLADYININRFTAVIRGLRNSTDFDYELALAQGSDMLYKHNTQTVFLMTRPELSFISSSMVREVASLGGDVDSWVTYEVKKALDNKYRRI